MDSNTLLTRVVEIARGYVGQREEPPGSNWGPFVERCLAAAGLYEAAPWCMAFAVYCYQRAGSMGNLITTASCAAQVQHARAAGTLIDAGDVITGTVTLQPGWLMCVWEDDLGRYAHTGIVATADGTRFTSIEGNTNDDGGREGQAVMIHARDAADHTASGHRKYCFIRSA